VTVIKFSHALYHKNVKKFVFFPLFDDMTRILSSGQNKS